VVVVEGSDSAQIVLRQATRIGSFQLPARSATDTVVTDLGVQPAAPQVQMPGSCELPPEHTAVPQQGLSTTQDCPFGTQLGHGAPHSTWQCAKLVCLSTTQNEPPGQPTPKSRSQLVESSCWQLRSETQMDAPDGTTVAQKQLPLSSDLQVVGPQVLGVLIWAAACVALSVTLAATSGTA
jgi:hypothetical protein